jgi:beta-lactamase regulating signal transducer with metallopeptidase domain
MNSVLVELLSMLLEFSLIVVLILLGRPWALSVAGPLWTYRLWYIPVAYFALSLIGQYAPTNWSSSQHVLTLNTHTLIQNTLPVDHKDNYLAIILGLWLLIALASFTVFMVRYWFATHDLKTERSTIAQSSPGKHRIRAIYSKKQTVPSTFGLFKPTLLLPINFHVQFTSLQQELIIEHELNHMRRRDSLFNFLWLFCCCLFWFNPICYLAWKALKLDQELSCDFLTLQMRSREEKATYGELIVLMSNRQNPATLHCGIHSPFNQTMERIKMLKKKPKSKTSRIVGAILMCTYATGGLVLAQNDMIEQDSVRYVINNLDVLKHQNYGPLTIDIHDPFEPTESEDYLLGIWDENSPQRVAVRFDTERAESGEILTIVNINSYKNHETRESKKLVFIGDDIQHSIEFAENEMTDQPFKLDFQVQKTSAETNISDEQRKERFIEQHKNNQLRYSGE